MMYAIWCLLVALALVVLLGIPSLAQEKTASGKSKGARPAVYQTAMVTSPVAADPFKVLVLHPGDRTDFTTMESSVNDLSGVRNVITEYHSLSDPATSALLNRMRIRMALNQTMIVIQSPNGAITWGGPESALSSLDQSIAFPSPKMAQIIKSSQEGKDVLLVFSDNGKPNGERLIRAANAYAQTPANKAEAYVVDPSDPSDADIVSRTKLPADSLNDARLLLLVGGKVQGQLNGAFVTDSSIAALKKSCSGKSGCC